MTSMARRREHDDSGEYSDASQDVEHNNSGNDGGQPESDYDSQGSESDNSERDPENKENERRVDDDEDRSNPQYIPKRGTFYEHDDRTAASGEEANNATSEVAAEKKEGSEAGSERRRPPRKSDIVNKWSHDKFNENEQMPKSREELVAIYGYDIRNEDAPPHARRNRRYGRGPNKYTRTWEDEEAYRRQSAAQQQARKPPNPEDFPELEPAGRGRGKGRSPRPRSKSQPTVNEPVENGTQLRRNASIKTGKKPTVKQTPVKNVVVKPQPAKPQKETLPPLENLTITATVNNQGQAPRKVNAVAQQRPVPTDQAKKKPLTQTQPQVNSTRNKSPPQLQPASQPHQQKHQTKQQNQQQTNQQQPNQQQQPAAAGGSKRYSSLRQRPLAETYTPQQQPQQQRSQQQQQQQPQQQQQQQQQPQQQKQQQQPQPQHRYAGPGEFVPGQAPLQSNPAPHLIHQQVRVTGVGGHAASPPQHAPPPQLAPQQHAQQVRLGLMEPQQMVTHPHHLPQPHALPQPHTIGQLQPSQGYAPPAMMPAQYMQQSGTGAVYGGAMLCGPPHAPYSHPAQIYQAPHHNYASQAGGVTYYNCAEQELQPRAQRRPTAAIPIVRPQASDRPANSTEKDNIDRIVENMFVRKPWPATHGADSKDKQPDNRSSQEPQSKESSQSNSLTSSSISTDSKPSESREEKTEEVKEVENVNTHVSEETVPAQESIATDA